MCIRDSVRGILGIIIREVGQQIPIMSDLASQSILYDLGRPSIHSTTSQSGTRLVDLLPISFYNELMFNQSTMTVSIHLTREEAEAYLAALDRATDNPFIQDDEECGPLFTLSGHIEGALYNTSTSN